MVVFPTRAHSFCVVERLSLVCCDAENRRVLNRVSFSKDWPLKMSSAFGVNLSSSFVNDSLRFGCAKPASSYETSWPNFKARHA